MLAQLGATSRHVTCLFIFLFQKNKFQDELHLLHRGVFAHWPVAGSHGDGEGLADSGNFQSGNQLHLKPRSSSSLLRRLQILLCHRHYGSSSLSGRCQPHLQWCHSTTQSSISYSTLMHTSPCAISTQSRSVSTVHLSTDDDPSSPPSALNSVLECFLIFTDLISCNKDRASNMYGLRSIVVQVGEDRHCQVELHLHGVFVCGHPDHQVERKIHHTSHSEKESSSEAAEWWQGSYEPALYGDL